MLSLFTKQAILKGGQPYRAFSFIKASLACLAMKANIIKLMNWSTIQGTCKLGCKRLSRTNTLAYWAKHCRRKKFYKIVPRGRMVTNTDGWFLTSKRFCIDGATTITITTLSITTLSIKPASIMNIVYIVIRSFTLFKCQLFTVMLNVVMVSVVYANSRGAVWVASGYWWQDN